MRRALRPDGRAAIAVWTEIDHSPPFAALEGAVREVAGDELADRYRSGPWGMPDADRLRELLEQADFTVPVNESPRSSRRRPALFATPAVEVERAKETRAALVLVTADPSPENVAALHRLHGRLAIRTPRR